MTAHACAAAAGQGTPLTQQAVPWRRLWELDVESHAPIVGICFPVAELRRLTDLLFTGRSRLDDFDLHAAVVAQCSTRNKVSQALQRELDRRSATVLRRFAAADTAQQLAALWRGALPEGDVGAALWACLTHPCCDSELHARLHKDLYLLQYERVASLRGDAAQRAALLSERQALAADAQRTQRRHALWRSQALIERQARQAEVAVLRSRVTAQDSLIAELREAAPQRAVPAAGREALVQRVDELTRQLSQVRSAAAAGAARCTPAVATRQAPAGRVVDASAEPPPVVAAAARLQDTSVLCVGGRSGQVPVYRELVERSGGYFSHHDGGIEDSPHRLDAQLAAADLVVCQSGCVNHNAYLRVKEHCKRFGKPCIYLAKPGAGGFVRALAQGPGLSSAPVQHEAFAAARG